MERALGWLAATISPLAIVSGLAAGLTSIDEGRRANLRPAALAPTAAFPGRGTAAASPGVVKSAAASDGAASQARRADAGSVPPKRIRQAPAAIERPAATSPAIHARPIVVEPVRR